MDARIELMRELADEFRMVAAGSAPGLAARFADAGFEYHYYLLDRGRNPFLDICTIASLSRLFRALHPQIVHTFDTKPCVWGPLAAWSARVPAIVATLTGVGGALYQRDGICTRAVRQLYLSLQKLASGVTNVTIFQNEEDSQHFISTEVVREEAARLIPGSGVSTARFAPDRVGDSARRELRSELGIQPCELVVTMVSRVIRSKGVLEFAAAARDIRGRKPQVRFLLVGPEDEESIDRLTVAEMTAVREVVTVAGPRQDIPVVLALSDVFVLPSSYREGIPRVLLEAASMGLPIVTTDSPGCNAVVADGVNGFLVRTRDAAGTSRAILALLDNPELRGRFGSASRQRAVERFDLSLIVKQTQLVYRDVLAHSLPARSAPASVSVSS